MAAKGGGTAADVQLDDERAGRVGARSRRLTKAWPGPLSLRAAGAALVSSSGSRRQLPARRAAPTFSAYPPAPPHRTMPAYATTMLPARVLASASGECLAHRG